MATKVDDLYLELGIDLNDFERDMAVADRKWQDMAGRLSRANRILKLRMDIDMAGYDDADRSVNALNTKIQHLNGILTNQRNIVDNTNRAYQESVRQHGQAAAASQRLAERLAREQKTLAEVEKQLRQTNDARSESYKRTAERANRAIDAISAALSAAGVTSVKAAMDAVESESLFEESFGGMADAARKWSKELRKDLGLNEYALRKNSGLLYTMFESMGLATPKAYELSTSLTELAYDMSSFYNIPVEQAFEKLRAGMTGEQEPLKALGILVNENTVKTYAYTEGIAKQGAVLTEQEKVLARYAAIMQQTARAQGNLAQTKDSPSNQLLMMREDAAQLAIEVGMHLLPELQKLLGLGRDIVGALNSLSDSTKDATMSAGTAAVEIAVVNTALVGLSWSLGLVIPWWGRLASAIVVATFNLSEYLKKKKAQAELEASQALGQTPSELVAKVRFNERTGYYEKEVEAIGLFGEKINHWARLSGEELDNLTKKIEENQNAWGDYKREDYNPNAGKTKEQIEKERAREEENAKRREMLAKQEAEKKLQITKEVQDELYRLTHSELEYELEAINRKAAELKDKGADAITVEKWVQESRKKIIEDTQRELDNTLANYTQSALNNRLRQIEQERQAWIKKTGDEVKATRLAEEQKAKILKETAMSYIQQYKEELEIINDLIKAKNNSITARVNGADVDYTTDLQAARIERAMKRLQELQKKRMGLDDLGFEITPEHIKMLDSFLFESERKLLPGFENLGQRASDAFWTTWQQQIGNVMPNIPNAAGGVGGRSAQPVTKQYSISIPVTINNPVVRQADDIDAMADKVASRIQKPLVQAISGGDEYGY